MNNSIYFILILLAGISCSEPELENDFSEVYESLLEQRHFYYNVEYNINTKDGESRSSLYGMVSLNRNADNGISSGYFGMTQNELPNYLHTLYLKNDWIHDLSSNLFDLNDADVLMDSLHSPILINPDLLFKIKASSRNIEQRKLNDEEIQWVFNLAQKPDQMILVWNEKLKKITELEYIYNLDTENTYRRKWAFEYLSKSDFSSLAKEYKYHNQTTQQPFL